MFMNNPSNILVSEIYYFTSFPETFNSALLQSLSPLVPPWTAAHPQMTRLEITISKVFCLRTGLPMVKDKSNFTLFSPMAYINTLLLV